MAFRIRFNDQSFPLDTPDLLEWVDARLPLGDLRLLLPPASPYPGKNLADIAYPYLPAPPEVRLGQYFYPTGASRWSQFVGVIHEDAKIAMEDAAFPVGQSAQPGTFTLQCDVGDGFGADAASNGGIQTQLYLLPPQPLSSFGSDFGKLYLCVLVDERFYWQWENAGELHPDDVMTWDVLLDDLANVLGITLTGPSPVPSVYGVPGEDSAFYSNYENPAVLLDAAAANIGCVVVRNLDGTYQLQTYHDADLASTGNRPNPPLSMAGGDAFVVDDTANNVARAANAVLPTTVAVTFPKVVINGPMVDGRDIRDKNKRSYGDVYGKPVDLLTYGPANYQGVDGHKTFHCTAWALYNNAGDASPVNQTALDALAVQLAKDFWDSKLNGIDQSYPGIRAWVPEGANDVLWYYNGTIAYTRVQRKPWNFEVTEFQHQLTGTAAGYAENPFPAKIIGASGTAYSWVEQEFTGNGATADRSGGRSGTTTVHPARDLNLMTGISSGTIIWLWRGYDNAGVPKQEYEFAAAVGGSLTVRDVYPTTLTIPNVTTFEVDRSTFVLDLIRPAAGTARLRAFANQFLICDYLFMCCELINLSGSGFNVVKPVTLTATPSPSPFSLSTLTPANFNAPDQLDPSALGPQMTSIINTGPGPLQIGGSMFSLPPAFAPLLNLAVGDSATFWNDICSSGSSNAKWRLISTTAQPGAAAPGGPITVYTNPQAFCGPLYACFTEIYLDASWRIDPNTGKNNGGYLDLNKYGAGTPVYRIKATQLTAINGFIPVGQPIQPNWDWDWDNDAGDDDISEGESGPQLILLINSGEAQDQPATDYALVLQNWADPVNPLWPYGSFFTPSALPFYLYPGCGVWLWYMPGRDPNIWFPDSGGYWTIIADAGGITGNEQFLEGFNQQCQPIWDYRGYKNGRRQDGMLPTGSY